MTEKLKLYLEAHPRLAAAFSGGADSAFLAYAAAKYSPGAEAFFVKTPFQPYSELEFALRFCREHGIKLHVLLLDTLKDGNVASNGPGRCYYCKRRIFEAIAEAAAGAGLEAVADGTNASDDPAGRPGMRALSELGVVSPLREAGLTKDDVRRLSREAGLETAEKPSDSCLATRQEAGVPITAIGLARTEKAEAALKKLGFSGFRVRTAGEKARLELTERDKELLNEKRQEVESALLALYAGVCVDPKARDEL